MLLTSEIETLYLLILDRKPENEGVVAEKTTASSLGEVARDMYMSKEFITSNRDLLDKMLTLDPNGPNASKLP
jgi:hypothetical protein